MDGMPWEPGPFTAEDERWMREAMAEAERAAGHGDVPIGAVVVAGGEAIGRGRNERELREDPTAHAEVLALREAAAALGSWRVLGATLYVTLEPCAMCSGAIVLARIPRVVFGTDDPKAGAAGSVLDVLAEPRLNHRPRVEGGLLQDACAAQLRGFFAARRGPSPLDLAAVARVRTELGEDWPDLLARFADDVRATVADIEAAEDEAVVAAAARRLRSGALLLGARELAAVAEGVPDPALLRAAAERALAALSERA